MKAMILAAGRGTRLRPLSDSKPKPMLEILGIPVLEHIIRHLLKYKINEIVINTSYLASQIENYFKDGSQFGAHIYYSYESEFIDDIQYPKAIGSAAGMKKVQNEKDFFDDTFIVLCGDALINLDIDKALRQHKQTTNAIASIILQEVNEEEVTKYGVVELSNNNKILSFQEKPSIDEARSTLINTGIYIFEPKIFDYIPTEGDYDIGSDLFPQLVALEEGIYGINIPFTWIDIGTLDDYIQANFKALGSKVNTFNIRPISHSFSAYISPSAQINLNTTQLKNLIFIDDSAIIEDDVILIGPVIIGKNAHIKKGAVLINSIIDTKECVQENAYLFDILLSNNNYVNIHAKKSSFPGIKPILGGNLSHAYMNKEKL